LILEWHWLTSFQNKALLVDIQSHVESQKQWLVRWEEQTIMLQLKKKKSFENVKRKQVQNISRSALGDGGLAEVVVCLGHQFLAARQGPPLCVVLLRYTIRPG
jgi:hypothetical protein